MQREREREREEALLLGSKASKAETSIELMSRGTWSPLCLGSTCTPGEGKESSPSLPLLLLLLLLGRRRGGGAFSFPPAAPAPAQEEEEEEEGSPVPDARGRRRVTSTPGEGSTDPPSSSSSSSLSSSCPSLQAGARTTYEDERRGTEGWRGRVEDEDEDEEGKWRSLDRVEEDEDPANEEEEEAEEEEEGAAGRTLTETWRRGLDETFTRANRALSATCRTFSTRSTTSCLLSASFPFSVANHEAARAKRSASNSRCSALLRWGPAEGALACGMLSSAALALDSTSCRFTTGRGTLGGGKGAPGKYMRCVKSTAEPVGAARPSGLEGTNGTPWPCVSVITSNE